MAVDISASTDRDLGADNFVKLELRKVTIDGKPYPLLAIYRKVGFYRYHTIREGWTERVDCRAFVFKAWPAILDIAKEENKAVKVSFLLHSIAEIEFATSAGDMKTKLQEEVQTSISKGAIYDDNGEAAKIRSKASFNLMVFPVTYEGKRSVRFLFDYERVVRDFGDHNLLTRAGQSGTLFDGDTGSELGEFDKWYFEVQRDAFVNFWSAKIPG